MNIKEFTENKEISINCCIQKIKNAGNIKLIKLRTDRYIIQGTCKDVSEICEGMYVTVTGTVRTEPRADYGFEIEISDFKIISRPECTPEISISGKTIDCSIDLNIQNRIATLRHPDERAVFRINESITSAFRKYMSENDFTEIHTPKISNTAMGNESKSFKIDYFDTDAYLVRTPQLYKQAAVAYFDRVYEIGPVYKNERRNSSRHLNEFIRLDAEIGYINEIEDILKTETELIKFIINHLKEKNTHELNLLNATLPDVSSIPVLKFEEVFEILNKKCLQSTLDPTDETRICEYIKKSHNSDFVYIVNLPTEKQPFYAMPGRGFSLLYKGMEISNGGQRIHNYKELIKSITQKNISTDGLDDYLNIFRYGVPPHGGFSIGLERFVMQLLSLNNIRRASLFPRDLHHLRP